MTQQNNTDVKGRPDISVPNNKNIKPTTDSTGIHGGNGIKPTTDSTGVHGGNGIKPNTGSFGVNGGISIKQNEDKPVITIETGRLKVSIFAPL